MNDTFYNRVGTRGAAGEHNSQRLFIRQKAGGAQVFFIGIIEMMNGVAVNDLFFGRYKIGVELAFAELH